MRKLTIEYVRTFIEKEGYKLLSKEYERSGKKLHIRCNKNHEYSVAWTNFQQGQRCPYCMGKGNLSYEYISNNIKKEGYKLLSEEYKNNGIKLKMRCNNNHECHITYANFSKGRRCRKCCRITTYEEVKCYVENNEGYKLLSQSFKSSKHYLDIQCPEGHVYKVRWNNFQQGFRCPKCFKARKMSREEKEVLEYVKSLTEHNIVENNRTLTINPKTGKNLEIDMWIPSLKKAIEFNGVYWHRNRKYYDDLKKDQCADMGIELLVIKDVDWREKTTQCRQKIRRHIGNNQ